MPRDTLNRVVSAGGENRDRVRYAVRRIDSDRSAMVTLWRGENMEKVSISHFRHSARVHNINLVSADKI